MPVPVEKFFGRIPEQIRGRLVPEGEPALRVETHHSLGKGVKDQSVANSSRQRKRLFRSFHGPRRIFKLAAHKNTARQGQPPAPDTSATQMAFILRKPFEPVESSKKPLLSVYLGIHGMTTLDTLDRLAS